MYNAIKRFVDIALGASSLFVLSPILIIAALLIRIEDGGQIFFLQSRIGRNGKPFILLKLRTMTEERRDFAEQVYENSSEVTAVGKVLRRFKVDELPQLLNVLIGEMSLVGPRPWLEETLAIFGDAAAIRHTVRPGLTGLAQVSGNVLLSWEERLAKDMEYINRKSLVLDLLILFRTCLVVIWGDRWGARER